MKIKKRRLLLFIVLLTVLALFLSSYINFRMLKIDNLYQNEFKDNLVTTIQQKASFNMKDLTPFDWDKAFIIQPYTSKTEMQQIVGKKWTNYNSYIGYLLEKTTLGKYPLDDDIFHKLVFVKGETIVLDVTIKRTTADFTQINEIIYYFDDDFLTISKMENGYPLIRRVK